MALHDLTATALKTHLARGELSAVEVVRHYLDRIATLDQRINAFLSVDAEGAVRQAERIDRDREHGRPLGALAGIPVAIKDILCQQGVPATCGSKMLEHYRPPYDATVVRMLQEAGAVVLGRTNMDEFAMGSSTENSAYGPTRNPWDTDRIPGGSSGGSAASMAARMTALAVGTDTGGSIRQPAALCGVVGMKPTYGRVSRYGLIAFASSLDQIGPMASSAEDAALLMATLAGHDPLDSTSADQPVPAFSQTVTQPLKNLRLGVIREHFGDGLDPQIEKAVREAIHVYESLGASVRELSLPHSKYGIATYYIIAPCEASSNLARYDGMHYGFRADEEQIRQELDAERQAAERAGRSSDQIDSLLVRVYRRTRAEGFGEEVKRRIMLGTYALSQGYYDKFYLKAQKVRRLIRQDYDRAFEQADLLIGPVTASLAFPLGEKTADPLAMYLEDLYTVTANLAGLPALSLPCGSSSQGLPIGLQLQAPAFQEDRLLRAAYMYQQQTDWHQGQAVPS